MISLTGISMFMVGGVGQMHEECNKHLFLPDTHTDSFAGDFM